MKPKKISRSTIRKEMSTLMASAFALVAALFWNDAIKSLIATYIPAGQDWPYMMASAIIVTIVAVIAIVLISKYLIKEEDS